MSDVQPDQYLFDNLLMLQELCPGNADFAGCLKEDMFSKPNRKAFDEVIYYLCRTYDPVRYTPKTPWPLLDRSQERTFRQNTVAFIKDIIKERPEARIPPFAPSFLSTPGGDRLIKFMWKFSLLVLKTVVERESDEVVLDYPTEGLHLVEAMTQMNLEEIGKDMDDMCAMLINAHTAADELKNEIKQQSAELKSLQSEGRTLIQSLDFLSDHEKSVLSKPDVKVCEWKPIAEKYYNIFNIKINEAIDLHSSIETQSSKIQHCYESVKTLIDSKKVPIVLDGSQYPAKLKDCNGNLEIAEVLFQASEAASSIRKNISSSGGLQPLGSVLTVLESMHSQLQCVQTSLTETTAGYANLISSSPEGTSSSKPANAGPGTPSLKGGLKLGYEMLKDAQMATPPLVFNINCDLPSKCPISAESPLMEELMGRPKPIALGQRHPESGTSFTPKASKSVRKPELSARLVGSYAPSSNSVADNIIQTPALFGLTRPATSTVCKPTSSLNSSKGMTLPFISKLKSLGSINLSQSNSPLSENVEALKNCKSDGDFAVEALKEREEIRSPDKNRKDEGKAASQSSSNVPVSEKSLALEGTSHAQNLFESPESSLGIFSPVSTNNSFFNDSHSDQGITVACAPKFDLDFEDEISPSERISLCPSSDVQEPLIVRESSSHSDKGIAAAFAPEFDLDFEDEISPSGRVSLCPSSNVLEPLIEGESSSNVPQGDTLEVPSSKPSSRRKSLQAIISRYKDIVASSKPYVPEKVATPPLSPELSLSDDCDLSLGFDAQL